MLSSEHLSILRSVVLGTVIALMLPEPLATADQRPVHSSVKTVVALAKELPETQPAIQGRSPRQPGPGHDALAAVPVLHKGDRWVYQVEKQLQRRAVQKVSIVEIAMTQEGVSGKHTYEVLGTVPLSGTTCYEVEVTGQQKLTGTYRTTVAGDALLSATGPMVETQSLNGREYWRVSDLALVKRVFEIESATQFLGDLARDAPKPISHKATVAYTPDAPIQALRFPLSEGQSWNVNANVTIRISGETATETHTETVSYTNEVTGPTKFEVSGEGLNVLVLSRSGTRTEESATGEVSFEKIGGKVYFSPKAKCIALDEADGKRLLSYHLSQ